MQRQRSAPRFAASARRLDRRVPGLNATPAPSPCSRACASTAPTSSAASTWKVTLSPPDARDLLEVVRRVVDHQVAVDPAAARRGSAARSSAGRPGRSSPAGRSGRRRRRSGRPARRRRAAARICSPRLREVGRVERRLDLDAAHQSLQPTPHPRVEPLLGACATTVRRAPLPRQVLVPARRSCWSPGSSCLTYVISKPVRRVPRSTASSAGRSARPPRCAPTRPSSATSPSTKGSRAAHGVPESAVDDVQTTDDGELRARPPKSATARSSTCSPGSRRRASELVARRSRSRRSARRDDGTWVEAATDAPLQPLRITVDTGTRCG